MCGIVGLWGPSENKEALIGKACEQIRHRGPDSNGFWQESDMALGHVRLAIQDLSAFGHQPMASTNSRYQMVFNGEIYNHYELRDQLQAQGHAYAWRGHSDTETLLACFSAWGIEQTLRSLVGMFAIALWDKAEKALYLMRDRFGEKPLYYGYAGADLVFASELKPLMVLPNFNKSLDRSAISALLRHNYIPAPLSIFSSIRKLEVASYVRIGLDDRQAKRIPERQTYWSAREIAENTQALRFESDEHAVGALDQVLKQAIKGQMLSDVSLGAFLSGGIDSSLIVSVMQSLSSDPIKTFSIGFDEKKYNEAEYAKVIANHLGTDHTEMIVTAKDGLDLIPNLAHIYDEPFADSSQIPTVLVMQMARKAVTVALSGDAGDELFGGYSRYQRAATWWLKRENLPSWSRGSLANIASLGGRFVGSSKQEKLQKLAEVLRAQDATQFYRQFVSYWKQPQEVVLGGEDFLGVFAGQALNSFTNSMMLLDTLGYLPDDILVKVDRAAMASSLETRVPLLDHRVFEFAWQLPDQYKIRGTSGKWILKQLLSNYIPRDMFERPKKGFSVPMGAWLRGPLKDWADALLDKQRLQQQGLLDAQAVSRCWQEHKSGKLDRSAYLWSILMLQSWLDHYQIKG